MTLSLETPALLFSATSLILLAYTIRFLTIAQIVRGLKSTYENNHSQSIFMQIKNLRKRLKLIKDIGNKNKWHINKMSKIKQKGFSRSRTNR